MTIKFGHLAPTRCLARLALAAIALAGLASPLNRAATIWTGPNITWTKSSSTPSDTIVPGKVVLTRGNSDVLYNTAAGEVRAGSTSPKDAMFAFGDLANATTLTYQTMESLRNGNLAARILNKAMVVHLVNEDIYFSIKFTTWGMHGVGGGTVSYARSTAPAAVAPTVTLTAPAEGSVFAAPANLHLSAEASVSGGTISDVSFFNGATLLGSVQTAPFNITARNLPAGAYSLTAVATAAGVSANSGVVHITIVSPADVLISPPAILNGSFSFNYAADPGLSYVVQSAPTINSTGALDWTSLSTNVAGTSSVNFSQPLTPSTARFFRVGRQPNP